MTDPLEINPIKQEKGPRMLKVQNARRESSTTLKAGTDFKEILDQVKQEKKEKTVNLIKAIAAVRTGDMSQRQAAMRFNIPRSTIQDRISGKKPLDVLQRNSNRPPLSYEEERGLMRWIQSMVNSGFDVPYQSLVDSALSIMRENPRSTSGERGMFESNWLQKFLHKWTEVR